MLSIINAVVGEVNMSMKNVANYSYGEANI